MEVNKVLYKAHSRRKHDKETRIGVLNSGRAERRKNLVDKRRIPANEVQHEPNMDNAADRPTGGETAPRTTLVQVKRRSK